MRRNQNNHKRRSTKLVQRPLIYTWYLPSNLLPSAFCLLPSAFCLLPSSFFLLPPSFCLLPSAFCLLPPSFCLLPPSFFLLPPSSFLLPSAFCLLPSAFCLLPSAFFLQLIAGNTFGSGGQLHCTGDSNGNSFVKNRWYNVFFVKLGRAN